MKKQPDYDLALEYAFRRLRTELSPNLTYHSYWHSRFEVMRAVRRMARQNALPVQEVRLLEVGAAFHDIGFVISDVDHEMLGASIAQQALPDFGFQPKHIERVVGLIMATRLPQTPHNLLEQILADADLDVLGRRDFFDRSEHLRQELISLGKGFSPKDWYAIQRDFLRSHAYFTPQAQMLRQPGKERHIDRLSKLLRDGRELATPLAQG